jgi:hypothetical protein
MNQQIHHEFGVYQEPADESVVRMRYVDAGHSGSGIEVTTLVYAFLQKYQEAESPICESA